MRIWLIALVGAACALSACSQKSSLYLQPGDKSAAQAPPKTPPAPSPAAAPSPTPAVAPTPTASPAPAQAAPAKP